MNPWMDLLENIITRKGNDIVSISQNTYMRLRNVIRNKLLRRKWRQQNQHNMTNMVNAFDINSVEVGNYTYGDLEIFSDCHDVRLKIGNFCSIASNVVFLLGLDHPTNHISTFPFKVLVTGSANREAISKGDIIVDDDVWIGRDARILSGVHIGQGAVIATGGSSDKRCTTLCNCWRNTCKGAEISF